MNLRFSASLHACFQTVMSAALLSVVLWPVAHAQPSKQITQAELQARLLEAKTNPEIEQKLYTVGRKVAAVCANCHADQNGTAILEVPYLDGQNPAYLVEQIRQFSQGLRKNTFMEGILKAMNRDEMVGMVLFYEKEKLPCCKRARLITSVSVSTATLQMAMAMSNCRVLRASTMATLI